MPKGEFRDSGGWVLVNYEGRFTMPMHRSDYEDHGYKPSFEALPLKEAQRNGAARDVKPRAN